MTMVFRTLLASILLLLTGLPPASAAQLSVFAASSLTGALGEITKSFEARNPGEQIILNFAGSQTLATQIEQGAPADLFISADLAVMQRLQTAGLVEKPRPLLRNRLVLAARAALSPALTQLEDLGRPNLLLAIGNPQVPIGRYTRQLFSDLAEDSGYGAELVTRINRNIVSEENRVKAIVAKLLLGEADAGIVYQSDLAASSAARLTAIPLPEKHSILVVYPVARVQGAQTGTERFADYLFSSAAQSVFAQHGFAQGGEE